MPKRKHGDRGHKGPDKDQDQVVVIPEARPIDGTGSVEANPDWGATGQELVRLAEAGFADGIGEMVDDRPNPREISNAVSQQTGEDPSSFGLSDMFWAWGQFIDHDLDLTDATAGETANIEVPAGDPQFDPDGSGDAVIPFTRIDYVEGTGEGTPREYENEITAFLDASMVYGSDAETAALRGDGGTLLLDEQGLLPRDEDGGVLAGDVRAGENVALTSLQTLFAREHNRIVEELAKTDPSLSDDQLYEAARARVAAEIQAITFNEFLPLLVGEDAIAAYDGYDPSVNPGISVEFSTAAFRFGHSLLSGEIERINEDGSTIAAGDLALRDAFFSPDEIAENGGIDPILRGLAEGTASELDTQIIEDVRSFLFGAPGSGGLDLASLNIQRGRDLGVASYNDLREAMGLERAENFTDITQDADLAAELEALYGDVDQVDAWIGGLAEPPHGDGVVGELFSAVIVDQFMRTRDGDPYWSEASSLPQAEIDELWSTTLADVIERNTDVDAIQDNVFQSYDRIAGTDDADGITGGESRDLLLGLSGDDTLDGLGGDDQLEGGAGNDVLIAGAGNDVVKGGAGRDVVSGGLGDDLIEGGKGKDVLVLDGLKQDYVFDFSDRSFSVEGGDGSVDMVSGVELVYFSGDAATFQLKNGQLVATSDKMVSKLLDGTVFDPDGTSLADNSAVGTTEDNGFLV